MNAPAKSAPPAAAGPADRLDVRATVVLLICCGCWGLNQVAIKVANAGISPVLQAGLRSLLAGVLVYLWAHVRGVKLFERDGTLRDGLIIGLVFAAEFLVIYQGLSLTTASRAVLFLYLSAFVVALGAHVFVPGDRLNATKSLGLVAAFVGLAVAMGEGLSAPDRPTLAGDLLTILGALLWGVSTIFVRVSRLQAALPEKILLYQLAVSGVTLPVASYALGESGITDLSLPVVLSFTYTFAVVAFATYVAWFWLVRNYPPSRVAAFTFLSPVFGVIAGNMLLGEPFTLSLAAALALITIGLILVNRPQ